MKQRYYPLRGFGTFLSAARFYPAFAEQRQYFRPVSRSGDAAFGSAGRPSWPRWPSPDGRPSRLRAAHHAPGTSRCLNPDATSLPATPNAKSSRPRSGNQSRAQPTAQDYSRGELTHSSTPGRESSLRYGTARTTRRGIGVRDSTCDHSPPCPVRTRQYNPSSGRSMPPRRRPAQRPRSAASPARHPYGPYRCPSCHAVPSVAAGSPSSKDVASMAGCWPGPAAISRAHASTGSDGAGALVSISAPAHVLQRHDHHEPHQYTMVRRSSTSVTPGADQAARSASRFSAWECTVPRSVTIPPETSTLIRPASVWALRMSAPSIFS